jgi:hypothetical protein
MASIRVPNRGTEVETPRKVNVTPAVCPAAGGAAARSNPAKVRTATIFRIKKDMVEAVGVEPTSEELRPSVSPCAARRSVLVSRAGGGHPTLETSP